MISEQGRRELEDVPWNMRRDAYGAFELEGMCIWVNKDRQGDWDKNSAAVLAHEFTHYVHSLSTFHSVFDLVDLMFLVQAGIQRLEELDSPPAFPLHEWSTRLTCPEGVKDYVSLVKKRSDRIRASRQMDLDRTPPKETGVSATYRRDNKLFIKTSASTGTPVGRHTLMEGAALAKKAEVLEDDSDLQAKKRNPEMAHYFAVHDACAAANPKLNSLITSALLCDICLCARQPTKPFELGLRALAALPTSATLDDFVAVLVALYERECRQSMSLALAMLEQHYAMVPDNHRSEENPSWGELTLRNAINAVRLRQKAPLSLIRPLYTGDSLLHLTSLIGSPVIITNDMRLSSLVQTSEGTSRARKLIRAISYICRWLLYSHGPLRCPYAGCPGCPEERRGAHCATNAKIALLPPDDIPWCALLSAAHQLRVAHFLRSAE
jgi:hypothetical protein